MFSASEDLYDIVYSVKDYPAEASRLAAIIEAELPGARRILDVACGTGKHLEILRRECGYDVEGLDVDPAMLALARERAPDAGFHLADMCAFNLNDRFDVVMCLFSSIGYANTPERIAGALSSFRSHLDLGGLLLIEPWLTPEAFTPHRSWMQTAESDSVKVCRMGWSTLDGRISRLQFEYLVGTDSGVDRRSELHELGLFTIEEMTMAIREAGFEVYHRPEGIGSGSQATRGLYVAHATS